MTVTTNPPTATRSIALCLDAANPKSYSSNVIPYPLDLYTWCKTATANSCTFSQNTTINRSPAGGIPLEMIPTAADPYIATYSSSAWSLAPAANGQTWTLSVWIKANITTNAQVFLFAANSSHSYITAPNSVFSVTTFWQRFTFSTTMTDANTAYVQCRLDGPDTGFGTDGVTRPTIWWDGLQLEQSATATTFNPVANLSRSNWFNVVDSTTPGTLVASPTFSTTYNGGIVLNGSTNGVTTNIPITATPALSNFTYEVWTSISSFPAVLAANGYGVTYQCGVLLGATYYAGAALYWYGNASGNACTMYGFMRGTDAYISTSGYGMSTNTVYHFVMVRDYAANKLRLYVNGTLFNEVAGSTAEYDVNNTPTAGNIGIATSQVDGGGTANYRPYGGTIYSARVYKSALTATEVQQNFNALKGRYGL